MAPHARFVRITHWVTALCFLALLVTGMEIVISHPRFYWGEEGNVEVPALFSLPIPASRASVVTGYGYVLPDQNGWSRALHFQSAWLVIGAGLVYAFFGLRSGHFRRNLLPARASLSWSAVYRELREHLTRIPADTGSYNLLQRMAYVKVVFILFPLMIWTGLAMSPAFVSVFPATVTILGGHQSARTIHFIACLALVLFLLVHIAMVIRAGFRTRTLAMITSRPASTQEPL